MAIPVVQACAAEEPYPPQPPGGGGGGGGNPPPPPEDGSFRVENQDGSGHTHWFEISCSELDANKLTWVAQGGHTHNVTLTQALFDAILAGDTVLVETSGGHPHTWVIAMPGETC
jgi:hypothetical protein